MASSEPTPVTSIEPSLEIISKHQGQEKPTSKDMSCVKMLPSKSPGGGDDGIPKEEEVYRTLTKQGFSQLHTYDELEVLNSHPQYGYLARKIKEQQMDFLLDEKTDVTQVDLCDFDKDLDATLNTTRLEISGILHSIDIQYLNNRLRETNDDSYAILSVHPDDWVAGRTQCPDPEQRWCNWSLHGRLEWDSEHTTTTTSGRGGGDGVGEQSKKRGELGTLSDRPGRPPGSGMQNGRVVTSPVVDHQIIELADEGTSPLLRYLPSAVRFIDTHLQVTGRRVLVHCKVGHSRSAAVAVAYLMHRYYDSVVARDEDFIRWKDTAARIDHMKAKCDAIFRWLKTRRAGVKAGDNNFTRQLHSYAEYLVTGAMPDRIPAPAIKRDGGDQMRDAALLVFFNQRQRPFPNLVRHYFETRGPALYRFPPEMLEFMLPYLLADDRAEDPHTGQSESVESRA